MKTIIILWMMLLSPLPALAADLVDLPGIEININDDGGEKQELSTAIKVAAGLTILSLAPAILMMMTSFTRIVIVLSILRHALGMQQTPPNTVIISLSIFLTIFSMWPVIDRINTEAYQPYSEGKQDVSTFLMNTKIPLRDFMISQTREQDLALMLDVSKAPRPKGVDDIQFFTLIPAFMISELKSAFQIGFIIFIPFLLIDIVVASILMSMGMMMVPPMMMSLPIKILMFVLIDGWNLIVSSLLGSFF